MGPVMTTAAFASVAPLGFQSRAGHALSSLQPVIPVPSRRPSGRRKAIHSPSMNVSPLPKVEASTIPAVAPFDWTNRWYPILWEEDFDSSKPYAFTLWDRPLVMFRDASTGSFAVLDDRCPHRAAPLSEGRVYVRPSGDTVLECGYHGWTYACSGACVRIPQTEVPGKEVPVPKNADMSKVYKTHVRIGIVFVWFGDREPDEGKLRLPDWLERGYGNPEVVVYRNQTRVLPYDFLTFHESNVIDAAHVPFSHHGSGQGDRNKINANGFENPRPGQDGAFSVRFYNRSSASVPTVSFTPPSSICYAFGASEEGGTPRFSLLAMGSPAGRGKTRALTCFIAIKLPRLMQFFLRIVPRWWQHTRANLILDSDAGHLRGQERLMQIEDNDGFGGAWKRGYICGNGRWDRPVVYLRKWIDANAKSMPWTSKPLVPTIGEVLQREDVIERFNSHTRDCKSCMGALQTMRVIRIVCSVLIIAGVFTAISSAVVTVGLGKTVPAVWSVGVGSVVTTTLALIVFALCSRWIPLFLYTDLGHQLATAD